MNLLLGIILGVLLTIGTAFMADAFTTADVTADVTSQPCSNQIVNWDIAKERLHETTASIETGWTRLKSSFRSL